MLFGDNLVSFKEEDQYINGIVFSLTRTQSLQIVNHFRKERKWTKYFYYEVGQYYLSNIDIIEILNLKCPFWIDKNVTFLYQGYSITEKHNLTGLSFQSIYKKNNMESHFYLCFGNLSDQIKEANLPYNTILSDEILLRFEDEHMQFDTENFYYKLCIVPLNNIFSNSLEQFQLD